MRVFLLTQPSSNSEAMRSWECFYEPSHLLIVKQHSHDRIISLLEDDWVHKTLSWPHHFTIRRWLGSHECFYEPSLLLIVKWCGHESVLWTQSYSNSETRRSWECFYEHSHLLIVKRCGHESVFMNPVWPRRFTVRRWLGSQKTLMTASFHY
jgi:hypothetical protein